MVSQVTSLNDLFNSLSIASNIFKLLDDIYRNIKLKKKKKMNCWINLLYVVPMQFSDATVIIIYTVQSTC